MILPHDDDAFDHLSSVTHDGKVVLFATSKIKSEGFGRIWYAVRQDGFESGALDKKAGTKTDWTDWRALPLSGHSSSAAKDHSTDEDKSVQDLEAKTLTYGNGARYVHRSLYDTFEMTADAPVQLVSGMGHLYVFRQSLVGRLLVDRFVLDGEKNVLVRKLEVRFKRSRQKFKASGKMKRGKNGLSNVDSLDFRDIDNMPFYEPTTEISVVESMQKGWFSVVLAPTIKEDQFRWHIFAYSTSEKSVVLTSIRASDQGMFDVQDQIGLTEEQIKAGARPWGIVKRTLFLSDDKGALPITGGFSATKYDLQKMKKTENGDQLLRDKTRVLLVVPSTYDPEDAARACAASLSFAILGDGSLSPISNDVYGTDYPLRADEFDVALPLDNLDRVRALSKARPTPTGQIEKLSRNEDDLVVIATRADISDIELGDRITLEGDAKNGVYQDIMLVKIGVLAAAVSGQVTHLVLKAPLSRSLSPGTKIRITGDGQSHVFQVSYGEKGTLDIYVDRRELDVPEGATIELADCFIVKPVPEQDPLIGSWTKVEDKDTGLVFDGIVLGQENDGDNGLVIDAPGHGLMAGDKVQIIDTAPLRGDYAVTQKDGDALTLLMPFKTGQAINLKRQSDLRRALRLSSGSCIEIPDHEIKQPLRSRTFAMTMSAWIKKPKPNAPGEDLPSQIDVMSLEGSSEFRSALWILGGEKPGFWCSLPNRHIDLQGPDPLPDDEWVHLAATLKWVPKGDANIVITAELMQNGERVAIEAFEDTFEPQDIEQRSLKIAGYNAVSRETSDVRLWSTAQTAQQVKQTMYLPLTGSEPDLIGYWRLGGITEGEKQTVTDFSTFANDGIIYGSAVVSARQLSRHMEDQITEAVMYQNADLVAVVEQGSYIEGFEFRLNPRVLVASSDHTMTMPDGKMPFVQSFWGQSSRSSDDRIRFAEDPAISPTHIHAIHDQPGWYRATCRVEIPLGVSMIRTLELSDFHGDWTNIDIRRHRLKLVDNTITEARYDDHPLLTALDVITPPQSAIDLVCQHEDQDVALTIETDFLRNRIAELEEIRTADQRKREVRIEEFNRKISQLTETYKERLDARKRALGVLNMQEADILNYWWALQNYEDMTKFVRIFTKSYGLLYGDVGAGPEGLYSNNQFKLVEVSDNRFRIDCRFNGLTLARYGFEMPGFYNPMSFGGMSFTPQVDQSDKNMLRGSSDLEDGALWSVSENTDGSYALKAADEDLYFTRGGNHIYLAPKITANTQKFSFQKAFNQPVNDKINDALRVYNVVASKVPAAYAKLQAQIRSRDAYLALTIDEQGLLDTRARLKQVQDMHTQTLQDLRNANIAYMNDANPPDAALEMAALDQSLTTGAVLEFVKPIGRICALESMAGMVQLSYFEHNGRMATTCYDTCADKTNSQFEEWLPPVVPALMQRVSGAGNGVKTPVPLGSDWTVEFWVKGPLSPTDGVWTAFTDHDGRGPVFVEDGEFKSIDGDGTKHVSGVYADDVGPGWHHIAFAIGTIKGATTVTYYLNGQEVGVPTPIVNHSALAAISGTNQQRGQAIDMRAWNTRLKPAEIRITRDTAITGDEPGLIAWFPANLGGRNALDFKPDDINQDGQSVAFTAPKGRPVDTTLVLDGMSEVISIPGFKNYNMYTSEWTLEFWICPEEQQENQQLFGNFGPVKGHITQAAGLSQFRVTSAGPITELARNTWYRISIACYDGTLSIYVNGTLAHDTPVGDIPSNTDPVTIGGGDGAFFKGRITELRLWDRPMTVEKMNAMTHQRLSGCEQNLAGYWPLKAAKRGDPLVAVELVKGKNAKLAHGLYDPDSRLKFGGREAVSCEYSTFEKPVDGPSTPLLRRMFAYPLDGAIAVQSDQRIDTLTLQWVGNTQYDPTLLGYIEGPPPVPSENLTVEESYNGGASVELRTSDELTYSWNRAKESAWGSDGELFLGYEQEFDEGVTIPLVGQVASLEGLKTKTGFAGSVASSHGDSGESTISTGSTNATSDRIELRGHREATAKFPVLGRRYVPKNVGYALVVSGLADVFITRLHKSGRMVSYDIRPNKDVPLDINTITFLINPAYTMNGSLDGQSGSQATSERFFRQVPAMRAQFGSSYPASYMRLVEAYDLKKQIELQDKSREAYFQNFDAAVSKLLSDGGLDAEINKGSVPKTIGLATPDVADGSKDKRTQEEKAAAQQADVDKQMKDLKSSGKQQLAGSKEKVNTKIAQIHNIQDSSHRRNALQKFEQWQIRMEALRVRAGKRNIVNTYVWDGDGGLRSEEQQFSSTIEHSLGSAVDLEVAFGGTTELSVMGPATELTAQATFNMTQTLHKTHDQTTALELSVDLGGVESTGITDFKDRPLIPGEKVDRYRFMSFYLEGSKKNFDDFFAFVVDPEWLASNDEEARSLRAAKGKSNKTWRVLHRVTYVERPALLGFGPDRRTLELSPSAKDTSLSRLELMELQIKELLRLMRGNEGC